MLVKDKASNSTLDTLSTLSYYTGLTQMGKMTGINVSNMSQKWVVLVSAKRLSGPTDEKCLSQHMLPPWMSLDVLYYFNLSEEGPKGFIVTEQIQDIFIEEDP